MAISRNRTGKKHAGRWIVRALFVGVVAAACLFAYTRLSMRFWHSAVPSMAAAQDQADSVVVSKSRRRLWLLRTGKVLREYTISLGPQPTGRKEREGDGRTPEGRYVIDWRNPRSMAFLSLHVSYPDERDRAHARSRNIQPGGNIMIHGLPNGWGLLGELHRRRDWTNGCIAVTNAEMQEIWARVPTGTPIRIAP